MTTPTTSKGTNVCFEACFVDALSVKCPSLTNFISIVMSQFRQRMWGSLMLHHYSCLVQRSAMFCSHFKQNGAYYSLPEERFSRRQGVQSLSSPSRRWKKCQSRRPATLLTATHRVREKEMSHWSPQLTLTSGDHVVFYSADGRQENHRWTPRATPSWSGDGTTC